MALPHKYELHTTGNDNFSRAKAQRRKEKPAQRGSALRLCGFARDIFLA
jgi:hypothetical protein